jgi:hypothetical protein
MKKDNSELEDELLPEYDLKSLRVRKLGSRRKSFGSEVVRLEPDVAEMFPTADAVTAPPVAMRYSLISES